MKAKELQGWHKSDEELGVILAEVEALMDTMDIHHREPSDVDGASGMTQAPTDARAPPSEQTAGPAQGGR